MLQYIVRRLFASIPVLFGILLVTFALARLIPGDPCRAILGEKATEAVCSKFIEEKGLNKPILTQFGIYIGDMTRGKFGDSFRLGMPVTRLLLERLPTTFELSLAALLVSLVVGIPLGIISAVRHNSWLDVITLVWGNIGVSMPVFWLGGTRLFYGERRPSHGHKHRQHHTAHIDRLEKREHLERHGLHLVQFRPLFLAQER